MALDTEAIWEAIRQRLQDETEGFVTVTRRRREWALEEYPVLFISSDTGDEVPTGAADDPAPIWRITGDLWVMDRSSPTDQDPQPTASVDTLKVSVIAALERKPSDPCADGVQGHYWNVGGLVRYLTVTRVEKGTGEKTGQPMAHISLEMETY